MRNLIPVFIACVLIMLLLDACNKDTVTKISSNNVYSMKLAYNDTTANFNSCVVSTVVQGNTPTQILISGFNSTNNKISGQSFELDITADIDSLKAGQAFPAATVTQEDHTVTMYFFPDSTRTYTTQIANPIGSVTITSVNSSEIKGTFNGGLYGWNDAYAVELDYTIAGGTFTAKR
jgi:hypothetical protein